MGPPGQKGGKPKMGIKIKLGSGAQKIKEEAEQERLEAERKLETEIADHLSFKFLKEHIEKLRGVAKEIHKIASSEPDNLRNHYRIFFRFCVMGEMAKEVNPEAMEKIGLSFAFKRIAKLRNAMCHNIFLMESPDAITSLYKNMDNMQTMLSYMGDLLDKKCDIKTRAEFRANLKEHFFDDLFRLLSDKERKKYNEGKGGYKKGSAEMDIVYLARIKKEFLSLEYFRQENRLDEETMGACQFCLLMIGDAIKSLTKDTRHAHHNIKWDEMTQLRNNLIHRYDRIAPTELCKNIDEYIRYKNHSLFKNVVVEEDIIRSPSKKTPPLRSPSKRPLTRSGSENITSPQKKHTLEDKEETQPRKKSNISESDASSPSTENIEKQSKATTLPRKLTFDI